MEFISCKFFLPAPRLHLNERLGFGSNPSNHIDHRQMNDWCDVLRSLPEHRTKNRRRTIYRPRKTEGRPSAYNSSYLLPKLCTHQSISHRSHCHYVFGLAIADMRGWKVKVKVTSLITAFLSIIPHNHQYYFFAISIRLCIRLRPYELRAGVENKMCHDYHNNRDRMVVWWASMDTTIQSATISVTTDITSQHNYTSNNLTAIMPHSSRWGEEDLRCWTLQQNKHMRVMHRRAIAMVRQRFILYHEFTSTRGKSYYYTDSRVL